MKKRYVIAALLAVTALAAHDAATHGAAAQQVGTATAVNPDAQGNQAPLTVGARIIHKERIQTSPKGTTQLLFLDKSSLSIGPNSNLVIDEFVFDPNAGTGHSAITLAQGAFRYVGGLLSHQGEAMINTSAAVIGVRGGTVTVANTGQGTRIIDLHGLMMIHNGCGNRDIKRAGYGLTVLNWNTCPPEPLPVTQAEIAYYLRLLTSTSQQNGSVPGFHNATNVGGVGTFGPGTTVTTGNGGTDPGDIQIQATEHGTDRPPEIIIIRRPHGD